MQALGEGFSFQQAVADGVGLIAVGDDDGAILQAAHGMVNDQEGSSSLLASKASVWMPSSVSVNTRLRELALRPMIQ